jgi:Flp pilus assembly pilin Flp
MLKGRRFGNSMVDYALVFALTSAVLLSLGGYLKRGLMGKYKEAGDAFGYGRQYDNSVPAIVPVTPVAAKPATPACRRCTLVSGASFICCSQSKANSCAANWVNCVASTATAGTGCCS